MFTYFISSPLLVRNSLGGFWFGRFSIRLALICALGGRDKVDWVLECGNGYGVGVRDGEGE